LSTKPSNSPTNTTKCLSKTDKLVLKFVTKEKMTRNWIRDNIFHAILYNKIKNEILSKTEVEYSLRKLAKLGLIKTEKWQEVTKRVYWK
jgi:predicted MarR family transcription regulator